MKIMKRIAPFAFAGLTTLASAPTLAADYSPPQELGDKWRGAYVAVSGGYGWLRDVDFRFPAPFNTTFGQDFVGGVSAGYLVQSNHLTFGGEVGYRRQNIEFVGIQPALGQRVFAEDLYSVTLRSGVAHDNWLVTSNFSFNYATTSLGMNGAGFGLGVSADYLFTDNIFAGVSADHQFYRNFAGAPVTADLTTVMARVGFKL